MKTLFIGKRNKGQIFSMDVMFALLPVMIIIGSSLQYLYLAEEQMKATAENSRLESMTRGLSSYVVNSFKATGKPTNDLYDDRYVKAGKCNELKKALSDFGDKLPNNYVYHARVGSYYNYTFGSPGLLCDDNSDNLWSTPIGGVPPGLEKYALEYINNTAFSEMRFLVEFNDTGMIPGHIAGISFSVWEDIS